MKEISDNAYCDESPIICFLLKRSSVGALDTGKYVWANVIVCENKHISKLKKGRLLLRFFTNNNLSQPFLKS